MLKVLNIITHFLLRYLQMISPIEVCQLYGTQNLAHMCIISSYHTTYQYSEIKLSRKILEQKEWLYQQ